MNPNKNSTPINSIRRQDNSELVQSILNDMEQPVDHRSVQGGNDNNEYQQMSQPQMMPQQPQMVPQMVQMVQPVYQQQQDDGQVYDETYEEGYEDAQPVQSYTLEYFIKEFRQMLLAIVIIFSANLKTIDKNIITYLPQLADLGELSLYGSLVKSFVFGLIFYIINKFVF